jgi:VWFA-related protein
MVKTALAAAAAASMAIVLAAQQPPAQPPVFRARTDIVEVDVTVQDKNGQFVTDLKPSEVEVREEGEPQTIDTFYLVRGRTKVPSATDDLSPVEPVGAPPDARTRRTFVAFFDDEHLTPAGFKKVQAAALTLFSKELEDGDIGGVVQNGRMAGGHLTSARAELMKAVADAKPNSKTTSRRFDEQQWPRLTDVQATRIVVNDDRAVLAQAIERACADDPVQCRNAEIAIRGKAAQLVNETRASTAQTVQLMLAVLNGLARLDGRKTLLLLTEGFLADESWPLVKDAVGAAARANTRIYTLDARGLDRGGMATRLAGSDPGAQDASERRLNQLDFASDSVNSLAVDTGGFVVRNTNIFDAAVARIAADAGTYYVLGYRPAKTPDGRFRRIAVKVTRPGVAVRARRGYVAVPTAASTPTTQPRATAEATPSNGTPAASPTPSAPATAGGSEGAALDAARANASPAAPAAAAPLDRAPASTPAVRLRPDAEAHVDTLGPAGGRDADAAAGWEAYKRGDVETARRALGAAAANPAAAPWVQYALGQSAYALNQFQDAVAAWEKVRAGTPGFEPVYFDLVDGYLQLKEQDKAIRLLREGAQRWPHDAEIFNALGVVQISRKAYDDAVASFEKAIAAAPADGVGYFNLAKAFELRYLRSRRYVQQSRSWVSNSADRDNAMVNYRRYLEIGGPFENSAREGLARLGWQKTR